MPGDHSPSDLSAPAGTSAGSSRQSHVLAGPVLRFDLTSELAQLSRQPAYQNHGPSGRTLVKEPDLRIVLIALKAGGQMEEHHASGPISIQVIKGGVRLHLPAGSLELQAGQLLSLQPGVPHDVAAIEDTGFLLTIGRTTYQQVSDQHEPKG